MYGERIIQDYGREFNEREGEIAWQAKLLRRKMT
jgi:hypothetical protein